MTLIRGGHRFGLFTLFGLKNFFAQNFKHFVKGFKFLSTNFPNVFFFFFFEIMIKIVKFQFKNRKFLAQI